MKRDREREREMEKGVLTLNEDNVIHKIEGVV